MSDRDEKIVETSTPAASHDEKISTTAHDEKVAAVNHVTDEPGRKGSVALNVIDNPLQRVSRETVIADARTFAETNGMADKVSLFTKAALVARDPDNFEQLTELEEDERAALIYERDHKWHGPKMLWYSIALCAVGAATQGWDQTGSNGANLGFPQEFGLSDRGYEGEWIIGLINSIIFLTAGLIGAWIVDPLNHWFGRRGEIFITALCLIATPIGSGFARTWQELFAARFVMGIGIGAKNATVPIFSAEMAPARIRGALVMFWQLWVTAGIFLGFCANVIVKDVGRIAWRLELGSAFIPSFVLAAGIYFCPESPRWLMKHGKIAQGFQSMNALRAHPIIGARDYYYSYVIYVEEVKLASGAGYFRRLADCFTVPRIRRANYGASTVMLAQQMCGINIISFYSSTIFKEIGYTHDQALFASLGYGAIQFVFTIPTLFLIDTKGRRTLCLITFPLMCLFLLAGGLSLLNTTGTKAEQIGPVVLFIYLFTIMYCLGEGPVAFQYSAEVFPTIQREQGMAWVVCINNTFAGLLSLTFPPMRRAMTQVGAFGFYAGLNLIAWGMIFCFVRETKQLTLEELDQVFSVPTSQYIGYETKVWLPYFIKRHIFRNKNVVKPPPIIEKAPRFEEAGKV
ncbi:putative sugar transporter [Periconia macrospinosa]|uniref:Putative sugar transporter n=1 Tax=Periconia macrospinosa TaxID=97972 RepID=A0A2V1DGA8_9PLEO|nr:putative sugar transporter [Periconia macrospinosa]